MTTIHRSQLWEVSSCDIEDTLRVSGEIRRHTGPSGIARGYCQLGATHIIVKVIADIAFDDGASATRLQDEKSCWFGHR